MEPLVIENNRANFLIDINPDLEFRMEFEVHQVVSWSMENIPIEKELYVTGVVKWDGCSHLIFGERNVDTGDQDGYLHFCGKYCFELHTDLMNEIYKLAEDKIEKFDKQIAG